MYLYIYIRICIYIYTYIHAYIKVFVSKTMSTTIRRRELKCGRSLNEILGLCCSFSCLNQGQCCSHFVSLPLFFSSSSLLLPSSSPLPPPVPPAPSIPSSFLSSFTVNASCALCRLSHVTFGLCAVQTACGQWVGGGRGGYEEAVMMSKALPFLFPLCIR